MWEDKKRRLKRGESGGVIGTTGGRLNETGREREVPPPSSLSLSLSLLHRKPPQSMEGRGEGGSVLALSPLPLPLSSVWRKGATVRHSPI